MALTRSRKALIGLMTVAILAIGMRAEPLLIWNTTRSVPVGLYVRTSAQSPRMGDIVAVRPDGALRRWLHDTGYLPSGALLLKRVAALPGQTVCRVGLELTIDGEPVAQARARSRQGIGLPSWSGCRVLGPGVLFLLNRAVPDSFDGRYFGPTNTASVVGTVRPLWLWEG